MSEFDALVANAIQAGDQGHHTPLPARPERRVTVLTCMDSRLRVLSMLGLEEGDAHVIRNAGGVATDDAIRSIIVSQRLLGTRAIFVVHHTDCGQAKYTDEEMKASIERETGIRPSFSFEAFADVESDVRQSLARIASSPFIPHKDDVTGFLYDVEAGSLRVVR